MIIYRTLDMLFDLIEALILIRVISSYIPNVRETGFYNAIHTLTEPVLYPVRNLLNKIGLNMGTIDFSPIFAFLLISIIRNMIIGIL